MSNVLSVGDSAHSATLIIIYIHFSENNYAYTLLVVISGAHP